MVVDVQDRQRTGVTGDGRGRDVVKVARAVEHQLGLALTGRRLRQPRGERAPGAPPGMKPEPVREVAGGDDLRSGIPDGGGNAVEVDGAQEHVSARRRRGRPCRRGRVRMSRR
ncbi:hypothetical protein WDZ92_21955, partial [Nostoc sp. NIES-2111]